MRSITPKSLYYIGILIPIAGLLVFVSLFLEVIQSGNTELAIILAAFNSIIVIHLFYYSNRHIYLRLDKPKRQIEYGNAFTRSLTDFSDIGEIKKSTLSSKSYSIRIRGKKYRFLNFNETQLDELQKGLRSE